jgi:hypothetical protein
MPTLFTDPRSGGVKKSSGVNVLPIVAETWAQVRDDSNASVDWLIASFDGSSKTDIKVIASGSGGLESCASMLSESNACYGGVKLKSGRFVTFYYAPDGCPVMQRGRGKYFSNILNAFGLTICTDEEGGYRFALLISVNVQKW